MMTKAGAQQQVKGFELTEIVKLAEAYRNAPNLSFDLSYTYADSANPTTILEQMSGSTKISGGKYWSKLDSVEFVQGGRYRLAVYHEDSTVVAADRAAYDDFLRLPFLDSAFRQANVDSMKVTTVSGPLWRLQIYFNPSSGFSKFVLEYDKNTYRTTKIEYYVKNSPVDNTGTAIGTAVITLTVSNYSLLPVDPLIFNEEKYIYKSNGVLVMKPTYAHFTLVNNTSN